MILNNKNYAPISKQEKDIAQFRQDRLPYRQSIEINGELMYGPVVQLFPLIQSKLNFSVQWVHVDDKKFGTIHPDVNDWNGIVGMLKRGEIDTSICDLSITQSRSTVISFTDPIRNYEYRLFMKNLALPYHGLRISVYFILIIGH